MKVYLPIGSVVILNNGTKTLMIYGRRQMAKSNGRIFDYIGCLYPEGNINEQYMYLFNHEDIKEVIFKGYMNEDENKFLEAMMNES